MSDPLPTFHAFQFKHDTGGEPVLVLRNTKDGSLSWLGEIGSDDIHESIKGATADMVRENKDTMVTAYGCLNSLEG